MNRPLRIVLGVCLALAALFAIVIVAIALRFDPNAYRPQIVDSVAQATGRSFELDGDLGLELFPCCAIALGTARLGNPEGFPAATFAEFDSASASVKLWPLLLRREVEIGTFRIEGLALDLVRGADGRGNWSFEGEAAVESSPEETSTSAPIAGLRMDSIDAGGADVRYRDATSGREYRASDVHVRTGAVLFQGALTVDTPDIALTATGDTLPNGRVELALAADRIVFAPDAGTLDIPGLALRIDDSTVTGDVAVADTGMLGFDLQIDRFDVDAYLPKPEQQKQAQAREQAGASTSEPTPIPLELIRRLKLVGNVRAGELTLFRTHLTQVEGSLRAEGGVLRVDPLAATLYGGQYRGTVIVDATGSQAAVRLDQALTRVQVGELLKSRYDSDRLSGALTATLVGSGSGRTTRDVLRTLAGTVDLDLADGVYRGTDFLYELRRARALLKQEAPPPKPAREETPIDVLEMQGRLGNGVMRSDAITLEIPAARVGGKGDLDLLALLLDYDLEAELVAAPDDPMSRDLEDLAGKPIPFTVTGPARDPKIRIDLEDLLKGEARSALERGLRKLFGGDRD
jgi:AsmA protein